MDIFPYLQRSNHFAVVPATVGVVCTMPGLWNCLIWTIAKNILERRYLQQHSEWMVWWSIYSKALSFEF